MVQIVGFMLCIFCHTKQTNIEHKQNTKHKPILNSNGLHAEVFGGEMNCDLQLLLKYNKNEDELTC